MHKLQADPIPTCPANCEELVVFDMFFLPIFYVVLTCGFRKYIEKLSLFFPTNCHDLQEHQDQLKANWDLKVQKRV